MGGFAMEAALPTQISDALASAATKVRADRSRYRVRAGDLDAKVVELASDGFVIASDGRPPLRGYADIFQGDERILRGLVICSWAQNGLVGYEFKRGTADGTAPVDYVRGPVAGLLPSA
ncbi:MAG: hypothetical protein AAFN51_03255 [Pseudomonadota bacterium]